MSKWIEKPNRTAPAAISLRETPESGAVYVQGDHCQIKHLWYATLDAPAIDTQVPTLSTLNRACLVKPGEAGKRGVIASITAWELPNGEFNVSGWMQGGGQGGRRYFGYHSPTGLADAHERIRRWAQRRFRVPA